MKATTTTTSARTSASALAPAAHDPDASASVPASASSSIRSRTTTTTTATTRRGNNAGTETDGRIGTRTGTGTGTRFSNALSAPTSPAPSRGASPIPASRIGPVTGRNNNNHRYAAPSSASRTSSPAFGGGGSGLLSGTGAGASGSSSSWAPSWASVQEFASSLLAAGEGSAAELLSGVTGSGNGNGNNGSGKRRPTSRRPGGGGDAAATRRRSANIETWGPEPPTMTTTTTTTEREWARRPRLEDVAAGTLAGREAALKAARTASVLESHDGVNGGLDVAGKFKRRNSDELVAGQRRGAWGEQGQEAAREGQEGRGGEEEEERLVYLHRVQKSDTYAGIVLKYRCREDAFRRANGLWSRDNIHLRKWLALPVDACEIRGRPCQPPTADSPHVDYLAPTPNETEESRQADDFFSSTSSSAATPAAANGRQVAEKAKAEEDEEDRLWTHVKWVSVDGFTQPVEIARVSRKALGYFPPRRKKSLRTASSTLSTPRGSLDVPSITLSSEAATAADSHSPRSAHSRRQSLLSASAPGDDDARPAWMRRPGGVGSLSRHVRAPGPEADYFNSWTKKHLPSLNMDSLPSMSVMGAETARFGFGNSGGAGDGGDAAGGAGGLIEEESAGIVESPFEDGRDLASASRQGSGLDKAAAAVETWLRGAFARRPSGASPSLGPRGRLLHQPHSYYQHHQQSVLPEDGDLIELTDTNSSDDGARGGGVWNANGTRGRIGGADLTTGAQSGLLSQIPYQSSGTSMSMSMSRSRSRGDGGNNNNGTVRGRMVAGGGTSKAGKTD